jgi:hypothetical protein
MWDFLETAQIIALQKSFPKKLSCMVDSILLGEQYVDKH